MALQAPSRREVDVVLPDGTPIHIRPIGPEDAPALIAFHLALSPESIRRRFFSAHPRLSESEATFFTSVDYVDRFALLAMVAGRVVGVARYDRMTPTTAEVAFVVADALQGHGIATLLLERLATAAEEQGITTFEADTLAENRSMLSVFRHVGTDVATHWADGVVHVAFAI